MHMRHSIAILVTVCVLVAGAGIGLGVSYHFVAHARRANAVNRWHLIKRNFKTTC